MKHRILTRPADAAKKRPQPLSPPVTPTKTTASSASSMSTTTGSGPTLNNNTLPGNFTKGSLIQLANGELRKVEDMKTEDFVKSAESNPELRLAESTVVRIEENPIVGSVTVTLSYNQNRHQVRIFKLFLSSSPIPKKLFLFNLSLPSIAKGRQREICCY